MASAEVNIEPLVVADELPDAAPSEAVESGSVFEHEHSDGRVLRATIDEVVGKCPFFDGMPRETVEMFLKMREIGAERRAREREQQQPKTANTTPAHETTRKQSVVPGKQTGDTGRQKLEEVSFQGNGMQAEPRVNMKPERLDSPHRLHITDAATEASVFHRQHDLLRNESVASALLHAQPEHKDHIARPSHSVIGTEAHVVRAASLVREPEVLKQAEDLASDIAKLTVREIVETAGLVSQMFSQEQPAGADADLSLNGVEEVTTPESSIGSEAMLVSEAAIELYDTLLTINEISDNPENGLRESAVELNNDGIIVTEDMTTLSRTVEAENATEPEPNVNKPSLAELLAKASEQMLLSSEDPVVATVKGIITDINVEFVRAQSNALRSETAAPITPAVLDKLLALMRALGYEHPNDVITEYVTAHGITALVHMLQTLCQFDAEGARHERIRAPMVAAVMHDDAGARIRAFGRRLLEFAFPNVMPESTLT